MVFVNSMSDLFHERVPSAFVDRVFDKVLETPRSWAERAYTDLIYYSKVDRGGHFAAWEQRQLFSEEVRAAFRSLC